MPSEREALRRWLEICSYELTGRKAFQHARSLGLTETFRGSGYKAQVNVWYVSDVILRSPLKIGQGMIFKRSPEPKRLQAMFGGFN